MNRLPMRSRQSRHGAVLAMALLFVLFCAGLMFAVAGIGDAVEYREATQQAADAGALALAHEWAARMNLAASLAEDEWNYVAAAMMFEMMEAPDVMPRQSLPPWTTPQVRLRPCLATSVGGGGINCPQASSLLQARAARVAARLRGGAGYSKLAPLTNDPTQIGSLGAEMTGALAVVEGALNGALPDKHQVKLEWLNVNSHGPGQEAVLQCQGPGGYDPKALFLQVFGRPGGTELFDRVGRHLSSGAEAYWTVCGQNPQTPWCTYDGAPVNSELRYPKAYHSGPNSTADSNLGYNTWIPRYLGRATSQYRACLPSPIRHPEQYRIVVRATGIDPAMLGRNNRKNVFAGAFSEDEKGRVDAAEAENNIYFTKFIRAGQYALAQASFGALDTDAKFRSGIAAAFAEDRTANKDYSVLPLHLWGKWGASLTRIHFNGMHGKLPACPGVPGGCQNADWAAWAAESAIH